VELQENGNGIIGGLSFNAGQLPPGWREAGLIGQAIVKKDGELLRLEWLEHRVLIFWPPANASLREPASNQPESDAVV
jgi:hypothetical protein